MSIFHLSKKSEAKKQSKAEKKASKALEKEAEKQLSGKKEKLLQIVSTQGFSPILDIRDGIILTKDGRYVKLLEFTPINFGLRSNSEQAAIISQFAAALRTMPETAQFKIISKRADASKFIDKLREEMERETNAKCRRLQEEQIQLIQRVSAIQGVSRRFIVAFEYVERVGLSHSPTFEQIRSELNQSANNIKSALDQCGNECISKDYDDEYILQLLYSIMCRNEADHRDFEMRENDVIMRYASENLSTSQDLFIPVNDFICPSVIDTRTSPNYIIVDGLYYTFLYLKSSAYPTKAYGGWLSLLINMGEGIDVDFWYHKENVASIQRKLVYKLRYNKLKLRDTDDTSQDYDDLKAAIRSGYYLKGGMASNDDFCYMGTMITITAHSLSELNYRYQAIKDHLIKHDLKIKRCFLQQKDAFLSTLPICKYNSGIWRKSRRNVLTSSLASAYPFVSYEMNDEDGILLGTNSTNGSLVFINNFDTKKYNNANIAIMGSSGAGKTYTLQCMALRMREKQIQVFIIAPLKGIEFERACRAVDGTFIKIAPGSGLNINIMEIRKKDESADLEVEEELGIIESILMKKIQQLHAFFSLLVPDIDYEEKQILDEALLKTYEKFGITTDNDSLVDPEHPDQYKPMPILGDLYETLQEMGYSKGRLYGSLTRYVTGSASSFNAPTNVNLDNKYVVLDVSSLTKETLPIGMFIALDYVWDKAREDRTKRKTIFIDETWRLIGPGSSEQAADFVLEIFKVIRGYGGSAVAATQDLNDFFALNDGMYGAGIINNAKTKMLMKTEPREADVVARAMDLTKSELEQIKRIKRGTCLLAANMNHVLIDIVASKTEHDLITTDASDLMRIQKEREKEKEKNQK